MSLRLPQHPSTAQDFNLPSINLKAHYDGETIRLDEPFDLPEGVQLIVTALEPAQPDGK
jgi:hypothetical protein